MICVPFETFKSNLACEKLFNTSAPLWGFVKVPHGSSESQSGGSMIIQGIVRDQAAVGTLKTQQCSNVVMKK